MDDYLKIIDKINLKFEQFKMLVLNETEEVKEIENFNLTPQQEIIMCYIIRNEPAIAIDIAHHLGISKSAVSQVITKLEKKDLIYRKVNETNRRESFIFLGKRGSKFQKLLQRIDETLVEKYYSKVTLDELTNVFNTLEKIVDTKNNKQEKR